ncbi:similar to Saccharomyces cerevisiae YGR033C TIM21 Nonessential subunit of the Translocase of the Inner Mitochondrial membrane (TIM23 complex) [Maudiozyma saulgeensis]|uniref:Mitochondrial import inner membrane translocase subunit Tim21 n=1 Tax=Maudiozyma saulgeensis TaxID=1789683 RepID=A0A1X7RB86_9SACH|nr:similar to Saccharomyces cerevisiae YGR033C TIM21 Nonessential subunit of the Translocase of the Inner Mitochondrial membrane (TIM23 complex) [Kazachstania saulgeensis]
MLSTFSIVRPKSLNSLTSRATLRILDSRLTSSITFPNSKRSISFTSQLNNESQKKQTSSKKVDSIWPKLKNFTTFTFSAALVVGAIGISTVVIYLIGAELFSPSGDTQLFNRAVSLVQKDKELRQLLQSNDTLYNERLKAYGEMITHDRWTRNRPIVSKRRIDKDGHVHCFLRFHIESKKKIGLVHCEAVEKQDSLLPEFVSLYVDIKGEKRHFIIKPKLKKQPKSTGFLGVNWGPKRT